MIREENKELDRDGKVDGPRSREKEEEGIEWTKREEQGESQRWDSVEYFVNKSNSR